MSTTTNLDTLKINYLTQAQYDTALENDQINDNELYFTPSSGGDGTSTPTANVTAAFDAAAHMNSTDMSAQDIEDFVDALDCQGYGFEALLINALKTVLVVEFKQFSGTWAANTATTISGSVAKSGYEPIGIVGASTNHGSVTLIRFFLSGTTGYVEGRNLATSAISGSPWVFVLYRKNNEE